MSCPTSVISVARVACSADDSTDRGSCRIRLPASVWTAAGIPYHKPVIVTLPNDDSSQPWRLLCIAALASEGDTLFSQPLEDPLRVPTPLSPLAPTPLSQPPQHRTPTSSSSSSSQNQKQQKRQRQQQKASLRGPVAASCAVLDPTVVLPPPGRTLSHLAELLAQTPPTAAAAEAAAEASCTAVAVCRGTVVTTATEVQVRIPRGQEYLVSPRMSFKLHQALVLPGCWLRLSPSCHLEVVSVLPEPRFPDQPLRIVPSTRLVMVSLIGELLPPSQQRQEQGKEQEEKKREEEQKKEQGKEQQQQQLETRPGADPCIAYSEQRSAHGSEAGELELSRVRLKVATSGDGGPSVRQGPHPADVMDTEPYSVAQKVEIVSIVTSGEGIGEGNGDVPTARTAMALAAIAAIGERSVVGGGKEPTSSMKPTASAVAESSGGTGTAGDGAATAPGKPRAPDTTKEARTESGSGSTSKKRTTKSLGSKSKVASSKAGTALMASASPFAALRGLGDDD